MKNEFTDNQALIDIFKVKGLIKDAQTEFIVEFEDGHQARVIAKGSEQKVRGINWNTKRPDLILGDDLENDELVMNEERREKFRRWFYNALMQCGSKGTNPAKFRIFGTILHMDSLLENIMPDPLDEYTVTEGLKQYSTKENPAWASVRYEACDEDFTVALWPEQMSIEKLKAEYQSFLGQGIPEGFSQEFRNRPIDAANAYFKPRDILPLSEDTSPETYYVGVDLAISEKDKRAFSVFTVVGYTAYGKARVREVSRFRGDGLEIIDEFFRINNKWKPDLFFVEKENIARTLGSFLSKAMQERDSYFAIEKCTPVQDKTQRARPLQARMREGMVEFDTEADWYPALERELLEFPRGKYVDQVDSLAHIFLGLSKMNEAYTNEELADLEYEEELRGSCWDKHTANKTTGY